MSWTGRIRGSSRGLRAAAQSIRYQSIPHNGSLARRVNQQLFCETHGLPNRSALQCSSRALTASSDGNDGSSVKNSSGAAPTEEFFSASYSELQDKEVLEAESTERPVSKAHNGKSRKRDTSHLSELDLNRGQGMYGDITNPYQLEATVMDEIMKFDFVVPTRMYMAIKNCANTNLNTSPGRCVDIATRLWKMLHFRVMMGRGFTFTSGHFAAYLSVFSATGRHNSINMSELEAQLAHEVNANGLDDMHPTLQRNLISCHARQGNVKRVQALNDRYREKTGENIVSYSLFLSQAQAEQYDYTGAMDTLVQDNHLYDSEAKWGFKAILTHASERGYSDIALQTVQREIEKTGKAPVGMMYNELARAFVVAGALDDVSETLKLRGEFAQYKHASVVLESAFIASCFTGSWDDAATVAAEFQAMGQWPLREAIVSVLQAYRARGLADRTAELLMFIDQIGWGQKYLVQYDVLEVALATYAEAGDAKNAIDLVKHVIDMPANVIHYDDILIQYALKAIANSQPDGNEAGQTEFQRLRWFYGDQLRWKQQVLYLAEQQEALHRTRVLDHGWRTIDKHKPYSPAVWEQLAKVEAGSRAPGWSKRPRIVNVERVQGQQKYAGFDTNNANAYETRLTALLRALTDDLTVIANEEANNQRTRQQKENALRDLKSSTVTKLQKIASQVSDLPWWTPGLTSALIRCHLANDGDIASAEGVVTQALSSGDISVHNTAALHEPFVRHYADVGDVATAVDKLKDILAHEPRVSHDLLVAVLDACAQAGDMGAALDVLGSVRGAGIPVTEPMLQRLVATACTTGEHAAAVALASMARSCDPVGSHTWTNWMAEVHARLGEECAQDMLRALQAEGGAQGVTMSHLESAVDALQEKEAVARVSQAELRQASPPKRMNLKEYWDEAFEELRSAIHTTLGENAGMMEITDALDTVDAERIIDLKSFSALMHKFYGSEGPLPPLLNDAILKLYLTRRGHHVVCKPDDAAVFEDGDLLLTTSALEVILGSYATASVKNVGVQQFVRRVLAHWNKQHAQGMEYTSDTERRAAIPKSLAIQMFEYPRMLQKMEDATQEFQHLLNRSDLNKKEMSGIVRGMLSLMIYRRDITGVASLLDELRGKGVHLRDTDCLEIIVQLQSTMLKAPMHFAAKLFEGIKNKDGVHGTDNDYHYNLKLLQYYCNARQPERAEALFQRMQENEKICNSQPAMWTRIYMMKSWALSGNHLHLVNAERVLDALMLDLQRIPGDIMSYMRGVMIQGYADAITSTPSSEHADLLGSLLRHMDFAVQGGKMPNRNTLVALVRAFATIGEGMYPQVNNLYVRARTQGDAGAMLKMFIRKILAEDSPNFGAIAKTMSLRKDVDNTNVLFMLQHCARKNDSELFEKFFKFTEYMAKNNPHYAQNLLGAHIMRMNLMLKYKKRGQGYTANDAPVSVCVRTPLTNVALSPCYASPLCVHVGSPHRRILRHFPAVAVSILNRFKWFIVTRSC
eukprot:m.1609589 g.1609589  ORF g.1609589 m.1609589 type:complete len:1486 (-) comp25365_c0_seq5:95-4552(-)